jgi:hypothetical protein
MLVRENYMITIPNTVRSPAIGRSFTILTESLKEGVRVPLENKLRMYDMTAAGTLRTVNGLEPPDYLAILIVLEDVQRNAITVLDNSSGR